MMHDQKNIKLLRNT